MKRIFLLILFMVAPLFGATQIDNNHLIYA